VKNACKINNSNICSTEIMSNDPMNNSDENYLPLNNCLTSLRQKEDTYRNSKKRRLDFDTTELLSNDGTEMDNREISPNNCLTPLKEKKDTYRKLLKNQNICDTCAPFLTANSDNMLKSTLIDIKTRGRLTYPSHDVVIIARSAERVIRANDYILFKHNNIKEFLIMKLFRQLVLIIQYLTIIL